MKRRPGEVRDAIVEVLSARAGGASLGDIQMGVSERLGPVSSSSIRSYLQLNTPRLFTKMERAQYSLNLYDDHGSVKKESHAATKRTLNTFEYEKTILINADCCDWLSSCDRSSIHAVVTDPPYGLIEYSSEQQEKLRNGKGGIWRIPPSFDGNKRSPLPRFTVLTATDLKALDVFFSSGRDFCLQH